MVLEVVSTREELDARAAVTVAERVNDAIGRRGRCSLALSRGSVLFRRLAECDVAWEAVDLYQVDERVAPDGHPDRNLTLISAELLARRDGLHPRVHPMPVTDDDLEVGAAHYARELEIAFGAPPVLDVVHLGLGPDGHTASLIPGDPVLDVRDRWVAVTRPHDRYRRMTVTYPVLDAARSVVFVVSGENKAEALAGVLAGDPALPAARIRAINVVYLCDAAAAAKASGA